MPILVYVSISAINAFVGEILEHRLYSAMGKQSNMCATIAELTIYDLLTLGIVTIYTVHIILVLRLYGLYGNKRLMYALSAFLCLSFVAEVYVVVTLAPNSTVVDLGPRIGRVCVPTVADELPFIW